ncbi:nitroreductase family protein [Eubacterium barkeri]|uniref:Nitroreductase n=1 Tax=Eubacterium barkeri TaxID=1528 RepID=A0A1H3AJX0_EUBBA|nr:nitroreductase family protein [Eubacterium barkeri]SDX29997.1 Nitroreductase [Eubacterium barkeri]
MMECRQAIMERRSIRRYKDEPIPREILEEILEAGTMAPSAVNLQPWYFVAVQSPDAMAKLKAVMGRSAEASREELEEQFPDHPEVVKESLDFIGGLGGAPLCILAFEFKDYDFEPVTITQSVAAAIENILLAAWERGVGSCWLTAPIETRMDEELRQVFAPDCGKMVAMVTLGYPEKTGRMPRRKTGRFIIV